MLSFISAKPSQVYELLLSSRAPTEEEIKVTKAAKTLDGLDEEVNRLHHQVFSGTILLFEINNADLLPKGKTIALGRHRAVFFHRTENTVDDLVQVVKETILGETNIKEMMGSIEAPRHEQAAEAASSATVLRRMVPARGYDILFSLLVPEPDEVSLKWNIAPAIDNQVEPFLDALANFSEFNVKSQVLYLTALNVRPKTSKDGRYKEVGAGELGLAINPVEAQLASHVSSNPRMNFLVYAPTVAQSPLKIVDDSDAHLPSNAFLIPRWGGVAIHNWDKSATAIDMEPYMNLFITQIRLLLGFQSAAESGAPASLLTLPARNGVRLLERDFLLRLRTLENVLTTQLTLQSLAHLLSQISNIVINDEIGEEVKDALTALESSAVAIQAGHVEDAFQASKSAFLASEKAFFDPTLLGLLYFPEDQKYAIYIPLFLPVFIPVILSFKTMWAYFKSE